MIEAGSDDVDRLASVATGREESVFGPDLERSGPALREAVEGRRILVIGGAGSIGAATTRLIADYGPAALHVVDQSENQLAELVRSLRSRREGFEVEDFRTYPIDYGSPVMRWVLDGAPYDAVLNFAALKHVRSERDTPSLMQMLDTNLLKNRTLMRELAARDFTGRYFCVSTDKAANPVSLMGASKRVMEHLIFSGRVVPEFRGEVTSARFANVAFSDGSLLHSLRGVSRCVSRSRRRGTPGAISSRRARAERYARSRRWSRPRGRSWCRTSSRPSS
jgi:FlaA1/EpsC-like NDP-sugar epimerase